MQVLFWECCLREVDNIFHVSEFKPHLSTKTEKHFFIKRVFSHSLVVDFLCGIIFVDPQQSRTKLDGTCSSVELRHAKFPWCKPLNTSPSLIKLRPKRTNHVSLWDMNHVIILFIIYHWPRGKFSSQCFLCFEIQDK